MRRRRAALFALGMANAAVAQMPAPVVIAAPVATPSVAPQPATAPFPAWVVQQAPAPAGKSDGAAARILLQDQQSRFERGVATSFNETVIEFETAHGRPAGNVAFAWNPQTDTPVIHRLAIRRGDTVIDLLASQSFTVLRREQNLEGAMLDGQLTASLQPEGLQVGDVLDFAMSLRSHDPVLGEHVERTGGGWNGLAIARAHFRASWTPEVALRVSQPDGLAPIRQSRDGTLRVAELSASDLPILPPPNGAPARFARARGVEMTDYRSWADLGAIMAPLYAHAAVLPATGALHDEWAKLDAAAPTAKAKAQAMLGFVEERVRYLALNMGAAGYTPADATTTWARRFGDCKGKTALLLALLHASGIDAVPVAANATGGGDGLDARLPLAGAFNHVLVRATINGRTYWLDATRAGDTDIDLLRVPNFGWGLPLVSRGAALVQLLPPPLDQPDEDRRITLDASKGLSLPAPFQVELTLRGDAGLATDLGLRPLPPEQRDRGLRDYWRKQYPFVEPETVQARFDAATGEEHLVMTGTATMDWRDGWYETDDTGLGWQTDFHRDPGPHRDAPFANAYPFFAHVVEVIALPPGFHGTVDKSRTDVNATIAGVEYRRTATMAPASFTVDMSRRSTAPEWPAADAPAAQAALRKLADNNVFLRRPDDYQRTAAEAEAGLKTTPTSFEDYVTRGIDLYALHQPAEAIDAYSHALALKPGNVDMLLARGWLYANTGATELADKDFAAVRTAAPHDDRLLAGEALAASKRQDFAKAIALLNEALAAQPSNPRLLNQRMQAERMVGDRKAALADADVLVKRFPNELDLQLARFNLMNTAGRAAEIPAAIDAMLAANPQNNYAHVIAARFLHARGDDAGAARAFDTALAIKPEAYIYVNRAMTHPASDLAGRRADINRALALDPTNNDVLLADAEWDQDAGRDADTLQRIAPLLAKSPRDANLLSLQGVALLRTGQSQRAAQSFAAERQAAAGDSAWLNNLCFNKAIRGVALDEALVECNAAITIRADAGTLDSRAMLYLRLGRLDAALADYDAALAKDPKLAPSLYGRAMVHARRGEAAAAAADEQAALALRPGMVKEFDGYGLSMPPTSSSTHARGAAPTP